MNAQVSGSLTVAGSTTLSSSVQIGSNSYSFPSSAPTSIGQLLSASSTTPPYTLAWSDPTNFLTICPVTVGTSAGCSIDIGISTAGTGDTVNIANQASTGTNQVYIASAPGVGGASEITIGSNQGASFTKIAAGTGGIVLTGPVTAGSAASSFDFSTSTQSFTTSSGTVYIKGDAVLDGGKTLTLTGSTSGSLSFSPPATVTSGTYTLPASSSSGILSNDGSGILSWATTAPASCVDIGTSVGCTMQIGVGTTGNDDISIANTVQSSPQVNIATQATGGATISIGSSAGTSKVTLTAGSGSINLAGNTVLADLKSFTAGGTGSSFDFSASTASFKTSAGTVTLEGNTVLADAKSFTAGGTGSVLDFSASTSNFKTSVGSVSLGGNTVLASGKTFGFAGSSGTLTFAAPNSAVSGTYTLPASSSSGILSNDGSGILSWGTTAPASCVDIGTSVGCTMQIGVGTTGSDDISIANTAQSSPKVNIATQATGGATISIGSSAGTSKVTLTAGSGSINLAGNTVVASGKTLGFAGSSGTLTFAAPNSAVSGTYTLPASASTSGYLSNNGLGVLSWSPVSVTLTDGGAAVGHTSLVATGSATNAPQVVGLVAGNGISLSSSGTDVTISANFGVCTSGSVDFNALTNPNTCANAVSVSCSNFPTSVTACLVQPIFAAADGEYHCAATGTAGSVSIRFCTQTTSTSNTPNPASTTLQIVYFT